MKTSNPLDRFTAEIGKIDREIDVAKASLYIAQLEYPDLDIDRYLQRLDLMAIAVQQRLPAQAYPLRIIQTISGYLYEHLNFRGNENNYYDPKNSFLNDVLDRQTGIPLTLSLVYLEIAKRINFPMLGIGMPGHFLIRPNFEDAAIFVDPFNCGEVLFAEDCRQKLIQLYQQDIPFLPPEILQPVTNRQFLLRMLNNLQAIYLNQPDFQRAATIKDWIQILMI